MLKAIATYIIRREALTAFVEFSNGKMWAASFPLHPGESLDSLRKRAEADIRRRVAKEGALVHSFTEVE